MNNLLHSRSRSDPTVQYSSLWRNCSRSRGQVQRVPEFRKSRDCLQVAGAVVSGSPILLDVEETSETIQEFTTRWKQRHLKFHLQTADNADTLVLKNMFDVWSGWRFTGIPHYQRGIKALFWEGICHMKNLPLQTTVRPAQAEGSVLPTALDLKEILILSRFKVQQSQVAVIPGKVYSKSWTWVGKIG